jgi:hypothetical protein
MHRLVALTLACLWSTAALDAAEPRELTELLAAYATAPHGYPGGPGQALPDTSVPFRWHHFHADAVARCDDAALLPHVDLHNPLDGDGVSVEAKSGVRMRWAAEQRTHGPLALVVDFPAEAIRAGKASVHIKAIAGGPSFSEYLRARNLMHTASCYGPHYRWIKLDAFHPGPEELHVRVAGVPLVLPVGACTIAVRTNDAVERGYACVFNSITVQVMEPAEDVRLILDHVRLEQEVPATLSRRGRMLQFAGRDAQGPPVLWPGFTPVDADTLYTPERGHGWTQPARTRKSAGHSFRSMENGILWGRVERIDAPLRIDVPAGRYGVHVIGAPGHGHVWAKGMTVRIHGRETRLLEPHSDAEVRRLALGGELVDYRPGLCVWEELVRPAYYPPLQTVYADAIDGHLLLEFPTTLSLHALLVFPSADKEAALREIGRLNYLMAESWDVSHPWVRRGYAEKVRYIGLHDEMQHPETIPARLRALELSDADFARGFVPFVRGLTEAVYPDTIPTPAEARVREIALFAARGERTAATLGLLPLGEVAGLQVNIDALTRGGGPAAARIPVEVRVSRYHQKCMQFGHHNHDYNYAEQYLVRRPRLDLHPGAARRVYFDLVVPADIDPGDYRATITIASAGGAPLWTAALRIEVLPFTLDTPALFLAASVDDPRLLDYGFNTFHASHDSAVKHGYRGYVANLGYGAVPFAGKPLGWSNLLEHKELVAPLLEAGRAGKGPRGFFGGPAPGTHSSPKAAAVADEFFTRVRQELPHIDLLGRTVPAFYFRQGKSGFQVPHEWIVLAAAARPDDPQALERARFWYIDGLRHDKEQAGRFTFGFWLWRSGAQGRFTTLEAHLQYGYGTARESYTHEPYFTLLDVTTCNVDRALKESLAAGEVNPSRDLILLREGINDYRYILTLENRLRHGDSPAQRAARKFRDELHAEVALDLETYYEARAGAYGENWRPLPANPWTTAKFVQMRRAIVQHLRALEAAGQQ